MDASLQRARYLPGMRKHANQAAVHEDNQLRPALEGVQEMLQCRTVADRRSARRGVIPAILLYFSSILIFRFRELKWRRRAAAGQNFREI